MAQVSLSSYCDEVRSLIKAGAYDDAMAIGRYILQHYPKHFVVYQLLGEACLGKGLFDEASDLFTRVLSVDPENVDARLSLSKVFEAKGDISGAVLQMREAFDLAPSVASLRVELNRLIRQQLGSEPPKLKLTRQGLGRIYLRGGLYTQAADEFETLLRENSDQVDVGVSLAESLWRDGQRIRSIEICQNVLNKLPYCIKANLILGETWVNSDRQDEGESHLQRVRAVDPEGAFASQFMSDSSLVPSIGVTLPRMEKPSTFVAAEHEDLPGWLAQETSESGLPSVAPVLVGAGVEAIAASSDEDDAAIEDLDMSDIPDWLKQVQPEQQPEASAETAAVEAPEAEEIAPWLGEVDAETVETADADSVAVDEPDWFRDLKAQTLKEQGLAQEPIAPESSEEETPDWLSEQLAGEAESAAAAGSEESQPEELPTAEDEGMPAWLRILREEGLEGDLPSEEALADAAEGAPVAEEEQAAEVEEVPDWLRTLQQEGPDVEVTSMEESNLTASTEAVEPEATEATEAAGAAVDEEDGAMPAWLRILQEEGLADELPSEEELAAAQATEEAAPVAAEAQADAPEAEEDVPAWLKILREEGLEGDLPTAEQLASGYVAPAGEPNQPQAGESEEEVPDWLRILREEGLEAELPTDAAATEAEAIEETPTVVPEGEAGQAEAADEALPDWLKDAWLAETAAEAATPIAETQSAESAVEEAPAETVETAAEADTDEEADGIPDWLRDLAPAAVETETASSELAGIEEDQEPDTSIGDGEEPAWLRILKEEGLEAELPSESDLAAAGLLSVAESTAPEADVAVEETAAEPDEAQSIEGYESEPLWRRILRGEDIDLDTESSLAEAGLVQADASMPEEQIDSEAEIPDWLREAAREEGLFEDTLTASSAAAALEPATEIADAEPMPDAEAAAIDEPTPEMAVQGVEEAVASAEPVEEQPQANWLDSLRADGVANMILPVKASATNDQPVAALDVSGTEQGEEIPTWLRVLRQGNVEDQNVTAAEAIDAPSVDQAQAEAIAPEAESGPEWLTQLRMEASAAEEETAEAEPEPVVPAVAAAPAAPPPVQEPKIDQLTILGYEHVVESSPKDYLSRWKLAQAYASIGNHEAAVQQSQHLVEAGQMLGQVSDYLDAAINSGVRNRQIYQLLGDAHFKEGHLENAVDAYRKALSFLY